MLDSFVNRGLDQAPYIPWILRYLVSRYPQQSLPLFGQPPLSTTHLRQSSQCGTLIRSIAHGKMRQTDRYDLGMPPLMMVAPCARPSGFARG